MPNANYYNLLVVLLFLSGWCVCAYKCPNEEQIERSMKWCKHLSGTSWNATFKGQLTFDNRLIHCR